VRGYAGAIIGFLFAVILLSIGSYIFVTYLRSSTAMSSAEGFAAGVSHLQSILGIRFISADWYQSTGTLVLKAQNSGTVGFDLNGVDVFADHVLVGRCYDGNVACSDTSDDNYLEPTEYLTVSFPYPRCPTTVTISPGPTAFTDYDITCHYAWLYFVVPPTPDDGATLSTGSSAEIELNADAPDVNSIYLDWNGFLATYYPYYTGSTSIRDINDSNAVLLMSFNDVAAVGEDYANNSTVHDYSQYGNDGTIQGAIYVDTGRYGGAFYFPKEGNILVPDSQSLDVNTAITLEAWVKTADTSDQMVIGKDNAYILAVSGGKVYFNFYSSSAGNWNCWAYSNTSVDDNAWHHIAATYDSTTGQVDIYVDGNLDATTSCSGTIAASTSPLYIGTLWSNWEFNGLIDDVQVYRSVKSSEQIWYDAHAATLYSPARTYLDLNTPALTTGTYDYYGWAQTLGGLSDYSHDPTTLEEYNAANPRTLVVT